MAQRAFLLCWVVVLACVGVTWAETPVTSGPVSSGTVSVAPANVEPVAAPVRAVVRDAEGRFVKPPVLDRSAAPSRGPLVGFEVDPATGEVALMAPAEVNGPAKAIISGSFALDSVTCTNCGGCPALGDRTLAVVLEATQYVAAESYGVSDLVSSNYTATGVVHTVPELNPGDLLSITISGDIGVCGTFRVFFDMCDTPPQDPTGACEGGTECGVDCWGEQGCLTPAGRCVRFSCRAGNDGPSWCDSCMGWQEVTYQQWMSQGYCGDVIQAFRASDGTVTRCGEAPSCCDSAGNCSGWDNAWHFHDGANNFATGPCLGCVGNVDCTFWNFVDNSAYTRISVCERLEAR